MKVIMSDLKSKLIVVTLVLSNLWLAAENATRMCSSADSKTARSIIAHNLRPRYHLYHSEMPLTCPFHSVFDQYELHEKHKRHLGSNWVCSVCGKSFPDEEIIDKHLEKNHPSSLSSSQGCLADYCDILRCDVYLKKITRETFNCDKIAINELRNQCMDIMRTKCVYSDMSATSKLHLEAALQASVCNFLTCDTYLTLTEDETSDLFHYYYFTYAVLFFVLCAFVMFYFRVASTTADESLTWEQFMKNEKENIAREPIGRLPKIPSNQSMNVRRREPVTTRKWSENE